MAYTTPRTWVAGAVLTAAELNQDIRDNQLAAFPLAVGAWTTYAPTNVNITVGNGTQTAAYQRIGRVIIVRYNLVWGSTTAFGGNPVVGLPVTPVAGAVPLISGVYNDNTTRYFVASGVIPAATVGVLLAHTEAGNTGVVNATNPFTWVSGDSCAISVAYEAAA